VNNRHEETLANPENGLGARKKLKVKSVELRVPARIMKHQNLQDRTKRFALDVIRLCETLPKDDTSRVISRQLLRAGSSVGANYRAVCRARSRPDFISKMGVVLEEADESAFWIELLQDAGKAGSERTAVLLREANELVAIFVSSLHTARGNVEAQSGA
jgi:four helix bundle protein